MIRNVMESLQQRIPFIGGNRLLICSDLIHEIETFSPYWTCSRGSRAWTREVDITLHGANLFSQVEILLTVLEGLVFSFLERQRIRHHHRVQLQQTRHSWRHEFDHEDRVNQVMQRRQAWKRLCRATRAPTAILVDASCRRRGGGEGWAHCMLVWSSMLVLS